MRALPAHGTPSRYAHKQQPCRCALCREAQRIRMAAFRHIGTSRGAVPQPLSRQPTEYRCAGCGGRATSPAGHPQCAEHISTILPRVLDEIGGR